MADSKILNHPDREEIIQKLVAGFSPNKVNEWLNKKYSTEEDKHNRITVKTISDFRTRYLNLNREAVRILKKERQKKNMGLPHNANAGSFLEKTDETQEEYELRVKETLLQSPTYREKLKEITEATLDGPRLIKELVSLIQSRLEVYFNAIASGTTVGDTLKADKQFAEYVSLMKDLVKDAKKIDDDYNNQPEAGQVDLNVVHEQVGMIRDTVKDLLNELAPDLALEFMDRLNKRMTNLKYEPPRAPDILKHVEKLTQRIKEMQETGDQ